MLQYFDSFLHELAKHSRILWHYIEKIADNVILQNLVNLSCYLTFDE